MRQLIIVVIAAGLIAYDLFLLNGYYTRVVLAQAAYAWNTIEKFLLGLF